MIQLIIKKSKFNLFKNKNSEGASLYRFIIKIYTRNYNIELYSKDTVYFIQSLLYTSLTHMLFIK